MGVCVAKVPENTGPVTSESKPLKHSKESSASSTATTNNIREKYKFDPRTASQKEAEKQSILTSTDDSQAVLETKTESSKDSGIPSIKIETKGHKRESRGDDNAGMKSSLQKKERAKEKEKEKNEKKERSIKELESDRFDNISTPTQSPKKENAAILTSTDIYTGNNNNKNGSSNNDSSKMEQTNESSNNNNKKKNRFITSDDIYNIENKSDSKSDKDNRLSELEQKKQEKHNKAVAKLLASKGRLESPDGLEWFPEGHGHKKAKKLFDWRDEIGHGVTGIVYSAIYKGRNCAVKKIERDNKWGTMLFTTEARILRKLKHCGIIELIDMYFDTCYFYLVMERAHFDLYRLIKLTDYLSEDQSGKIVTNLLKSIGYLHDRNIVHRDLKPENIVFNKADETLPKLVDFGDALYVKDDKTYREFVGTPPYMSRERLQEHQGWQLKKSDVWAIGVICYEMVAGERCFQGDSQKEIFRKVTRAEWSWPPDFEPSRECDDFVKWCLQKDAKDRPSCEEALKHPWLTGRRLKKGESFGNIRKKIATTTGAGSSTTNVTTDVNTKESQKKQKQGKTGKVSTDVVTATGIKKRDTIIVMNEEKESDSTKGNENDNENDINNDNTNDDNHQKVAISTTASLSHGKSGEEIESPVLSKFNDLVSLVSSTRLQQLLLRGVRQILSETDKQRFANEFKAIDKNKDGFIDITDLVTEFTNNGMDPNQATSIASILLNELDTHNAGKITMNEFIESRLQSELYKSRSNLHQLFKDIRDSSAMRRLIPKNASYGTGLSTVGSSLAGPTTPYSFDCKNKVRLTLEADASMPALSLDNNSTNNTNNNNVGIGAASTPGVSDGEGGVDGIGDGIGARSQSQFTLNKDDLDFINDETEDLSKAHITLKDIATFSLMNGAYETDKIISDSNNSDSENDNININSSNNSANLGSRNIIQDTQESSTNNNNNNETQYQALSTGKPSIDLGELSNLFSEFDKDGDGKLTFDDFIEAMKSKSLRSIVITDNNALKQTKLSKARNSDSNIDRDTLLGNTQKRKSQTIFKKNHKNKNKSKSQIKNETMKRIKSDEPLTPNSKTPQAHGAAGSDDYDTGFVMAVESIETNVSSVNERQHDTV